MNILYKSLVASAALASMVVLNISSASAQTAEYIIFDVKGSAAELTENFTLGGVLKVGDRIDLPKDAVVKLLDKSGNVVILTGPIAGTVTNEDGDSKKAKDGATALTVIAKLMFGDKKLVNNLGAARGLKTDDSVAKESQPWVPVIIKPGTYCLPMDVPVFGRVDASQKADVTIVASGAGIFSEKSWKENEKSISVLDMVETTTDQYTLILSSHKTKSQLHLLDRTGMNMTEQIAWMAERGCRFQAIQLLQEASASAG